MNEKNKEAIQYQPRGKTKLEQAKELYKSIKNLGEAMRVLTAVEEMTGRTGLSGRLCLAIFQVISNVASLEAYKQKIQYHPGKSMREMAKDVNESVDDLENVMHELAEVEAEIEKEMNSDRMSLRVCLAICNVILDAMTLEAKR